MRYLIKNWKIILFLGLSIIIVVALLYRNNLLKYLNDEAKTNWDNYVIEFTAGVIVAVLPILIGIYYGKKLKEYEFHNNVDGVLNTLIKLREKGLIKPLVIRQIVKSMALNFGNEALKEDIAEKAYKKYQSVGTKKSETCKVCTLNAEIEGKRCKTCKINCYAWDLSSITNEELEISEIQKLIEKENS